MNRIRSHSHHYNRSSRYWTDTLKRTPAIAATVVTTLNRQPSQIPKIRDKRAQRQPCKLLNHNQWPRCRQIIALLKGSRGRPRPPNHLNLISTPLTDQPVRWRSSSTEEELLVAPQQANLQPRNTQLTPNITIITNNTSRRPVVEYPSRSQWHLRVTTLAKWTPWTFSAYSNA